MLLFPLVLILDPTNALNMSVNIKGLVGFYFPMLSTVFVFILNQKFLVPQLVFKKRYATYFVCNSVLVVATLFFREVAFFVMERSPNEGVGDFFSSYCFSFVKGHFGVWPVISFTILVVFVCILCVLYHVMFRQIVRAFILREQKRSELQYELDFLKNQLSPHFLFNTLNNISALDILQKYADLEKLRLDESFDFVFNVNLENPKMMIEPLLVMPLMENAMKHCVNPNGKSFAHISITQASGDLHFHSENSNFPRKSSRKGSGLGLSTFEKRLDLIYLGSYEYSVNIVDGVYISDLIIHLKKEIS